MSFSCSKMRSTFSFSNFCVFKRLEQVLCLSVVGTVIGLNIVLVRQSIIKVLWCFLYVILSKETNTDLIVSKNQKRRRICFKDIMTPHKTWHPPSLTNLIFSIVFFYFFVIFPFSHHFVSMYLRTSLM